MATIAATVRRIQVYANQYGTDVTLTLDKEIEGYEQNDKGDYVKVTKKTVSFGRSILTAQLCDLDDDIALYRACQEEALTQEQLAKVLFNAKLTLEFTEHAKGEVVKNFDGSERTLERDMMFVVVKDIVMDSKAKARLDKYLGEM